ncbi:MAG TPA: hypothetical protein VMU07_01795 [Candidatus Paceibacterota bacterium]|nr:hypothetical protein [Candidatus Paceibacterota bacterium]
MSRRFARIIFSIAFVIVLAGSITMSVGLRAEDVNHPHARYGLMCVLTIVAVFVALGTINRAFFASGKPKDHGKLPEDLKHY